MLRHSMCCISDKQDRSGAALRVRKYPPISLSKHRQRVLPTHSLPLLEISLSEKRGKIVLED